MRYLVFALALVVSLTSCAGFVFNEYQPEIAPLADAEKVMVLVDIDVLPNRRVIASIDGQRLPTPVLSDSRYLVLILEEAPGVALAAGRTETFWEEFLGGVWRDLLQNEVIYSTPVNAGFSMRLVTNELEGTVLPPTFQEVVVETWNGNETPTPEEVAELVGDAGVDAAIVLDGELYTDIFDLGVSDSPEGARLNTIQIHQQFEIMYDGVSVVDADGSILYDEWDTPLEYKAFIGFENDSFEIGLVDSQKDQVGAYVRNTEEMIERATPVAILGASPYMQLFGRHIRGERE